MLSSSTLPSDSNTPNRTSTYAIQTKFSVLFFLNISILNSIPQITLPFFLFLTSTPFSPNYYYFNFLFKQTLFLPIRFASASRSHRRFVSLLSDLLNQCFTERWVAPRRMKIRAFSPPWLPASPCSAAPCTDLSTGIFSQTNKVSSLDSPYSYSNSWVYYHNSSVLCHHTSYLHLRLILSL